MGPRVIPFAKGQRWADPRTRRGLNALVDIANRRRTLRGDGLIRVTDSPAGTTIGLNLAQLLPRIPHAQLPQVGIVKNLGPASEADGSNEWYWVEPTYLPSTTEGSNTARALRGQTSRFRAIHLDEENGHTHTLATDGTVRVEWWWEEDAAGKRWPYFRRAQLDDVDWEALLGVWWVRDDDSPDNTKGAGLSYTNGALDWQQEVYYWWSADGSGNAEAHTLHDDGEPRSHAIDVSWEAIYTIYATGFDPTAPTMVKLQLGYCTASWDTDAAPLWANRPATTWLHTQALCEIAGLNDGTAAAFNVPALLFRDCGLPATCYGLAARLVLTDPPNPGNCVVQSWYNSTGGPLSLRRPQH